MPGRLQFYGKRQRCSFPGVAGDCGSERAYCSASLYLAGGERERVREVLTAGRNAIGDGSTIIADDNLTAWISPNIRRFIIGNRFPPEPAEAIFLCRARSSVTCRMI